MGKGDSRLGGRNHTPSLPDGSSTANTDAVPRNLPWEVEQSQASREGDLWEGHCGHRAGAPAEVRPLSGRKVAPPHHVGGTPLQPWSSATRFAGFLLPPSCRPLAPVLFSWFFPAVTIQGLKGGKMPLRSLYPHPLCRSVFSSSSSQHLPPLGVPSGLQVGCIFTNAGVGVIVGCQRQKGPESRPARVAK